MDIGNPEDVAKAVESFSDDEILRVMVTTAVSTLEATFAGAPLKLQKAKERMRALFLASPDLKSALEELAQAAFATDAIPLKHPVYAKARDAIAKAEGR